jgi:hypothetical protein
MTRGISFALGAALAVAGCGPAMSDEEVDRLSNDIRAAAEAQGLTVKQLNLRAESTDRAAGDAIVAWRDEPTREARWDCSADRLEGPRIRWRCAPPGRQAAAGPAPRQDGRAAFAGRWTDSGDCSVATLLGEDGTFVAPNGAQGNWDVQGSQLTFSGPNGAVTLSAVLDDANTMTVTTADGTTSRSTRC